MNLPGYHLPTKSDNLHKLDNGDWCIEAIKNGPNGETSLYSLSVTSNKTDTSFEISPSTIRVWKLHKD
jgi:hypothetical protein